MEQNDTSISHIVVIQLKLVQPVDRWGMEIYLQWENLKCKEFSAYHPKRFLQF